MRSKHISTQCSRAGTTSVNILTFLLHHVVGSVRSAAIIDILVSEGYSVAFQAMVQRDPAPEARLRAAGAAVLAVVPANQWAWSQQGGCPYDLIYVARRNVFQLALKAMQSGCPGVPIVYDTGRG